MSGGYFDYAQHSLDYEIAEKLEEAIKRSTDVDDPHFIQDASIREKFFEALILIRSAKVYINNIDYLLSGDSGEDTFMEHLHKDLGELADQLERFETECFNHEKSDDM